MNDDHLKRLVTDLVVKNNEDDLEAYTNISEALYENISKEPHIWLERILPSIQSPTVDYLGSLIEFIFEEIDLEYSSEYLEKLFYKSGLHIRRIILDNLGFSNDIKSLRLLMNLNANEISEQISKTISLTLIENEIRSGEVEKYLAECYENPMLPPIVKNQIWECLLKVYKRSLPLDNDHKEWLNTTRRVQFESVIITAKEKYKNGKYKTVVKLLEQFDSEILSDYAATILKLSKKRLAK